MFNVTVIDIKKSARYVVVLIITLIVIYMMAKGIAKIKTSKILEFNLSEELIECISKEIPSIESSYYRANNIIKEDTEDEQETSFVSEILGMELAQIKNNVQEESEEKTEEKQDENQQVANTEEQQDQEDATTQVVTQNPISESYNVEISGVKIKNETSFQINEAILEKQININRENITIFHTHTCESYTPSETYPYEQTGNFRTTDLFYSVARVGDELTNHLTEYGFNVVHDKTYHDYPAYTGSYNRSKVTVENLLKTNPSDIIIDLHRDAIGSKSNYDPSVKIGNDVGSQLMFVIGTNGGGLYHPDWQSNLKFAIEVQQKANEMYPGLFKPIIVRNSRYNQHLGKAACIIEVGATGNTLEQTITSMKYLAKVLNELKK